MALKDPSTWEGRDERFIGTRGYSKSRTETGDSKEVAMKLGMIGLGRMGGNMAQRLIRGGHEVVDVRLQNSLSNLRAMMKIETARMRRITFSPPLTAAWTPHQAPKAFPAARTRPNFQLTFPVRIKIIKAGIV